MQWTPSKVNYMWCSNSISFPPIFRVYRTLRFLILLYGCESWDFTAVMEQWIQAFEYKCFRKLLQFPYTEHKMNIFVKQEVNKHADRQYLVVSQVKRQKPTWYSHVSHHSSLPKTILSGTIWGGKGEVDSKNHCLTTPCTEQTTTQLTNYDREQKPVTTTENKE